VTMKNAVFFTLYSSYFLALKCKYNLILIALFMNLYPTFKRKLF
jgi:hypothetical protein